MKLELTDNLSGKKFVVCDSDIRLMEPALAADGITASGTHIVFDSTMGRVVSEDYTALKSIVGAVDVPAAAVVATQVKKAAAKK
jgi:hypothetical protein